MELRASMFEPHSNGQSFLQDTNHAVVVFNGKCHAREPG